MAEDEAARLHPDTIAVGYGYDPASAMGAAKPPLYLTSTFVFRSAEHAKEAHRLFFEGGRPAEDEPRRVPISRRRRGVLALAAIRPIVA